MNAKTVANIDGVKLMRQMTVHVRIRRYREMQWRLWIGMRLFALAASVMNCNVHVVRDKDST